MAIEATFEFVPAGELTAARVDFDEPAGSGPAIGTPTNDPRNGGLKLGLRVRVRKPGDAASRHLLEMGTCWPMSCCGWFAYATLTPESSGVPVVVAAESLVTARRAGRMLGVRRWSATHAWQFRLGANQFGGSVLTPEWTEVEWVKMFAQAGAEDDGSSVDAAVMLGRQGQAFSGHANWPAGWAATLSAPDLAACGEALVEAASKASFTVNYGDCAAVASEEWNVPTVDASPPPPPATAWERRESIPDDAEGRYLDGPDAPPSLPPEG